jgi:hypothetical protein
MRLFALHEGFYAGVQQRIELLADACNRENVALVCIDSLAYDYSNIPKLTRNDLLYNFARGSAVLESLLLNDEVTTFYIKNPQLTTFRSTPDWSIIHQKAGFQAPRTIYHLTADRALLRKYVDYLGGFPVIIKLRGGTRGIGTIKIDSWENLISTVDYLVTTADTFMMREFIQADYGARVIVLGDEAILSSKFLFQEHDFRNAPLDIALVYEPLEPDAATEKLCIDAVRAANIEMAGVDILFDRQKRPYLLEINFPTGFGSFGQNAGYVLSRMLRHLIGKSERSRG